MRFILIKKYHVFISPSTIYFIFEHNCELLRGLCSNSSICVFFFFLLVCRLFVKENSTSLKVQYKKRKIIVIHIVNKMKKGMMKSVREFSKQQIVFARKCSL